MVTEYNSTGDICLTKRIHDNIPQLSIKLTDHPYTPVLLATY